MLQALKFGAQYNFVAATGNDHSYGGEKLPHDKLAKLVKAIVSQEGQDAVVLTYNTAALKEAGIEEDRLFSKGKEAPIHDAETAEILTGQDCKTFRAEYPLFQESDLGATYLATTASNPAAKKFTVYV